MGTVRPRPDKPGKWWAKCIINGKEVRRTAFTEAEAQQLLIELELRKQIEEEAAAVEDLRDYKYGECLAVLLDKTVARRWKDKGKDQAENATRAVKALGLRTHPAELTKKRLRNYLLDELPEQGLGPNTINKYLSSVRALLEVAEELEWIEAIPSLPKRLPVPKKPKFTLTLDELQLVLSYFYENGMTLCADIFVFLVETGCRIGEALSLTYQDLKPATREVIFRDTKNGETRVVPVPAKVWDRIYAWEEHGKTYRKGRYANHVFPIAYRSFHERHMLAKHYVCDELNKSDVDRALWNTHTLRKTGLTLKANGWEGSRPQANFAQLSGFSGHKSASMVMHYINEAAMNLHELVVS